MPSETMKVGSRLGPHWARPDLFGITLLALYIDSFVINGEDDLDTVLNWDPATVEMEIWQDFGVDISGPAFDRLMTARGLLTSNSFFVSPTDFCRCCVVLSGDHVDGAELAIPECDDIAWGITEGLLINPPEDDEPFSPEILALIGVSLDDEGILNPPDVLKIATRDSRMADRARYEFSDDVEMFSAINKFETDKTSSINAMIKARLRTLLGQLQSIPIADGRATDVAKRLLAKLPDPDHDEPLPLPT